jgi:predicted dehydrogenase
VNAPEVGIGIVGYGLMAKAHSYGYTVARRIRELPCRPQLRVISGRNLPAAQDAARRYAVERAVSDWREVVNAPDVEIADICTPPGTHPEIAQAVADAGKAIVCEKPLAADYDGAAHAADAARQADIKHAVGFNYRHLPALSLMTAMVDAGRLGQPRLWRSTWLSDEFLDPEIPFDWRFERSSGSSTIADLGAHLIDLARWIISELESVSAQGKMFTTARPTADRRGKRIEVDVEDAAGALLRFRDGALGMSEAAKVCPGRPCDFTVEVNGTHGTLRFEYARLNELSYASADDPDELYGMRRIRAEPRDDRVVADRAGNRLRRQLRQPGSGPPGGVAGGVWTPDFETGLGAQAVCEAIERAAGERRWVDVAEVTGAHAPV